MIKPSPSRFAPGLAAVALWLLAALPGHAAPDPVDPAVARELSPAEQRELDAALADGVAALALDPASARAYAQRAGAGWAYTGWVDTRPDVADGLCRRLRYGLARAPGAARWRLDPHGEAYWSVAGAAGASIADVVRLASAGSPEAACTAEPVHLLGEVDSALFKRLVPRAPALLRDASLVIRGNTLCARETMAGMTLYEIGADLDARGRGEARLAYAPAVSSAARRPGRWNLTLRFRVTPDDVSPLAASCEDIGGSR
ncbi:MAG: hypothetical protein JO224_06695 [Pelomonas sp.]|nr:hypothetical protein [Roseateles sp.]